MRAKRVAMLLAIVVCCAGMAMAQTEWVDYPDNPVIGPGEPGEWDSEGRAGGAVLFDGSVYHMWFVGYSEDYEESGIGHATSADGVDWTMDPANPGLTHGAVGEWDQYFWNPAPAVIHDGTQFQMWYMGESSTEPDVVRGGYATSPDGSVWTKHSSNPVLDVGPPGSWDDQHARPGAVVFDGDTYKMWYSGYNGNIVLIGYAESTNGIEWTKHPDPVLDETHYPGVWDARACNPSVVFDGSRYHMWYAGWERSVGDWMVGYAFSTDGIAWIRHRDNPVISAVDGDIYSMPVIFDGSTWHGWYLVDVGDGARISYATSDCCPIVAGLSHAQYIPAAAVASGAQGSFYQTDVDLNNAGAEAVEYEFMWLPRGEDCLDPTTSDVFSLGADMSVRYANVLSEVFGLEPNSLGALSLVSSSPDLLAMSRTYNNPEGEDAGTFGQAVPAVAPDEFIQSGERRRILFASETDDLRFNVGCQNDSGEVTAVSVELFDGEGTSLERTMMVLPAWGNDQLNRVFENYMPVNGYVDVWTVQSGQSFYCYGSVLDNVTSDPTTILPQ